MLQRAGSQKSEVQVVWVEALDFRGPSRVFLLGVRPLPLSTPTIFVHPLQTGGWGLGGGW